MEGNEDGSSSRGLLKGWVISGSEAVRRRVGGIGRRNGLVCSRALDPDLVEKALGVVMAESAADSEEICWVEGGGIVEGF